MFGQLLVRHVDDVRKVMRAHVRSLDPAAVPLGDASAMWTAFDQIERHAAAAKTLLAARVDESRAWARSGDRSAAEHLARAGGTTTGAARARLETSQRLRGLPATEAALRRGELSQAQAETIAEAAAANPSSESTLLATARTRGMTELRERARRAKAAADPDPDATHRRIHDERRLRRFTDSEGAWNVQARGTADAGAVFNASLDPIIDELFRAAHRDGRHEPRDAYAFDALLELARRARSQRPDTDTDRTPAHRTTRPDGPGPDSPRTQPVTAAPTPATATNTTRSATTPGDTRPDPDSSGGTADGGTTADDGSPVARGGTVPDVPGEPEVPGQPEVRGEPDKPAPEPEPETSTSPTATDTTRPERARRRGTPNPTHLALLRIDVEALQRGAVEGDELCEIAGIGPVPVRIARRLLGDAIVKLVVTRGTDVANITHLGRGPTAAQRVALMWSTPACTNERCSNTLAIEHDHREPWTQVLETATGNLDRLCRPCHRRKTHKGWALVPGTGRRALVPPDDPRHPRHPRRPRPGDARAGDERHGHERPGEARAPEATRHAPSTPGQRDTPDRRARPAPERPRPAPSIEPTLFSEQMDQASPRSPVDQSRSPAEAVAR